MGRGFEDASSPHALISEGMDIRPESAAIFKSARLRINNRSPLLSKKTTGVARLLVQPFSIPTRVLFGAENSSGMKRLNHKGRSDGAGKVRTRLTSFPNPLEMNYLRFLRLVNRFMASCAGAEAPGSCLNDWRTSPSTSRCAAPPRRSRGTQIRQL